jgi:hypothetical protein
MPAKVTVLGIDSHCDSLIDPDPFMRPICQYRARHVYGWFGDNGFGVYELCGPDAIRNSVKQQACKPEVKYLTGVGHGVYSAYRGYLGETVFEVDNYKEKEVKGKIAHFVSCGTAHKLGVNFVKHGCSAYFGYDCDYTWHNVCPDAFFECDSEIDKAFAENHTAGEVYKRVKRLHEQWMARLRGMLTLAGDNAAAMLERNLKRLRCPSSGGPDWGSEDAKLR